MTAIKVELELVDGSFTTRMLHAGETIEQFNRNVARSSPELRRMASSGQMVITSMEKATERSQGFLGTLRDIAVVTGALSMGFNKLVNIQDTWIGKVVQTNAEFERLIFQMRSMSGAADPIKEAAAEVDGLLEAAKNAPFSLQALSHGFAKLKATGTDPLNGSLQAIQDGVAAFGGTDSTFERTVLGISQASGKGVIQMEELRQQIGESMPQAVALMAASMGVSMATLIDKISTGRMAAKPALDLFYAELERSFGGSARRMMETFSGQIARTQTQLQEFARIIGGVDKKTGLAAEGGFFATLTDQVRDLNDVLSSTGGQNFAMSIGQGLTQIVQALRSAVEIAYEWRAAIGNTAELLVFAAGMKLLVSGAMTLRGAYGSLLTSIESLRFGFARANAAAVLHQTALRNTALSVATVDRAGRAAASAGMAAMLGTMGRVAPVAGILGMAIYEVADAFDVFGNRGKEAIATLREFGQLSADQIGKAQDNIAKRQRDLTKEIAQIEYEAGKTVFFGRQEDRAAKIAQVIEEKKREAQIDERQREINEDLIKLADAKAKNEEQNAERAAQRQLREIDRVTEGEQRAYRDRQREIQKKYDDEVAAAKDTGKSIAQIDRERTEELRKNADAYYDQQIGHIQKTIDAIKQSAQGGKLDASNLLVVDELDKRLEELRERQKSLGSFGTIPDIGDVSGNEKSLDKFDKAIEKTRAEVKSLEEQLGGTGDELADFQAKFAAGAYGDTSTEQVRQLGEEMEKLLVRKQALDDINEGSKDIKNDIEQTRIKLIEKRMELQEKAAGRELTDGEKIAMRIKEGYYKGFGPNSPALQAVNGMIQGLSLQGKTATQVGAVMRENTFGDQTIGKIQTVNDKLAEMLGLISKIGNGVNGISFDKMGMPGVPGMFGMQGSTPVPQNISGDVSSRMQQALEYMMAKGWSKIAASGIVGNLFAESRMNPNAIGDNGNAFGLAQWNDRGPAMKAFLASQGKAWNDFFGQLDFIDHELRTTEARAGSQLRMARDPASASDIVMRQYERPAAWAMAKSGGERAGAAQQAFGMSANPSAPTVTNAAAVAPLPSAVPTFDPATQAEINAYLEQRNKLEEEYLKQAAELTTIEKDLNDTEKQQAANDYKSGLLKKIETAKESLDGLDKNYRATMQLINEGEFGSKDVNTKENQELLRIARELDAVEKGRADRKEAKGNIENAEVRLKEQELQMERKIAELKAKAANPNVRLESSGLIEMREQLDKYLADVATVYGQDTEQYRAAVERKKQILQQFSQQELWQDTAASAEKTRSMQQGLMTQAQARQSAMQQELAEVDARIAYYRQAGALDVQATEQFEAEKAAIRAKYAAQDPIGNKLKEWGDLQGNLQNAAAGWMDSLADGLAGLITGTGDLRSVLKNIANDMIKMLLKYAMSGIMGKKGAATGTGKAGKGTMTKGASSGKGKALGIPTLHTGGIAGFASARSFVNPQIFKNARKFHSGANQFGGRRLAPGEMPAIVKKDEGIFTPEQMKALGAAATSNNQSIAVSAPVTINSSGGTPEQNADLAKQVSREMEATMRGVVVSELQKQLRPGNMLSGRKN